jgi:hypothetical protein
MWHDDWPPDKPWSGLWNNLIVCGNCLAIRGMGGLCPSCLEPLSPGEPVTVTIDGRENAVLSATYMGAEGRYEDYLYLNLLQREWKRELTPAESLPVGPFGHVSSPKASIVILFWTYFETRIERLLRSGMRELSSRIVEDLLKRYASVGARIDRLYEVLYEASYWKDLDSLGFGQIRQHLVAVQEKRNAFAHGTPTAIDDALVTSVIDNLKEEHEAWIAVFNKRATRHRYA